MNTVLFVVGIQTPDGAICHHAGSDHEWAGLIFDAAHYLSVFAARQVAERFEGAKVERVCYAAGSWLVLSREVVAQ